MTLQTIAWRSADPLESLVVPVTSFRTESEAWNVMAKLVETRMLAA